MQIGELSRRTRCAIETIRYYERIGLMPRPGRRGRYREYQSTDVSRLAFIRQARSLGFALGEVRALLRLTAERRSVCVEARQLAAMHLRDVRRRIADLCGMERALASTIRQCNAGVRPTCPLIDTLSAVA